MSQRETVLDVAGMTCSSCVRHIGAALSTVSGVTGVDVQLRAGTVRVRHTPAASVPRMIEAITEAGYEARRSAAEGAEPRVAR